MAALSQPRARSQPKETKHTGHRVLERKTDHEISCYLRRSRSRCLAARSDGCHNPCRTRAIVRASKRRKPATGGRGHRRRRHSRTRLARDAAQLVGEAEGELLFEHSTRVFLWAALAGRHKGVQYHPELLYVASIFHDFGLTSAYRESHSRFEVDGANAARDFLRRHGVADAASERVWLAVALHTTNGISEHLSPIAALLAKAPA